MKYCLAMLAFATAALADGVPIAVFHGMGDFCKDPGMISFTRQLAAGTNAYGTCIEGGAIQRSILHTSLAQA